MTPAARVETAIALLDEIIAAARTGGASADTVIAEGLRTRRYAGSKDRRAIRELIYRAIRRFGEVPANARAAFVALADEDKELAAVFDGSPYGPLPIAPDEPRAAGGAMSGWLGALLPVEEHEALLERAPLDLRVNTLKATRETVQGRLGGEPIAGTVHGLRFAEPFAVEGTDTWQAGLVEVQDAGSQLIAAACQTLPGMTVVDFCAGAGGKTLALASDLRGEGRLIACDVDRRRLGKLGPRAQRAGAAVEERLLDGGREREGLRDLEGQADIVLVDAPCSGTGTLRRNPEARWRLTPERLDRLVGLQAHVLELAALLVRPSGALVYAVCSLITREGRDQVEGFLAAHPGWTAEPLPFGRPAGSGVILSPAHDGTDGFFVARLLAPC